MAPSNKSECEFWPLPGFPKLLKEKVGLFIRKIQSDKKEKKARTIFLLGGGEIGTEIGLAAFRKQWFVRAAISSSEAEPIINLPLYLDGSEKIPRRDEYFVSGEHPDFNNPFLCIRLKKPFNSTSLVSKIVNYRPDAVLLEDAFMTNESWKKLYSEVHRQLKEKSPIFIPPPNETTKLLDAPKSDIFLSKITMKRFLSKIKDMDKHLLGTSEDNVDIETLRQELKKERHGSEIPKIEAAFKKFNGKIIFKLDQTTSGHAQFVLQKLDDLTLEFLDRQIGYQTISHRAENRSFVMERYIEKEHKLEAIVIEVRRPKTKKQVLNQIYYKKYGEGKEKAEKFQGIARLAWSFTEKGEGKLWTYLESIAKKINDHLKVPFLYVEFILEFENANSEKPNVYINEISYRPDDAGFITFLSHERDEFSLFMDSLEASIHGYKLIKKRKVHLVHPEPKAPYACESLIPGQKIRFTGLLKDNLKYDFPDLDTKTETNNRFKLRLYQKTLGKKGTPITYGRIIGYLWHLREEDGRKVLRTFQEHKRISEKTMLRLVDSLPGKADEDLERGVSFAKREITDDYV